MTAYWTTNDGFTANDISFYKRKLNSYPIGCSQVSFQLIIHKILKITKRYFVYTYFMTFLTSSKKGTKTIGIKNSQ